MIRRAEGKKEEKGGEGGVNGKVRKNVLVGKPGMGEGGGVRGERGGGGKGLRAEEGAGAERDRKVGWNERE